MRVSKKQIFNLMDTNGRRTDVISAIQGYLSVLEEVTVQSCESWGHAPESLSQFKFYQKAIGLSPDVFKIHKPYDELMKKLEKCPGLKKAIDEDDKNYISDFAKKNPGFFSRFDKGIEDRARHYTSNLVKLGFADTERNISETGRLLLAPSKLKKDPLEKLLPIDGVNIIYLRQLLKLRVFDKTERYFYAPFVLALYTLLKRGRMSENAFLEMIQGSGPFTEYEDLEQFVMNYEDGDIAGSYEADIPLEIKTENMLTWEVFSSNFPNNKSGSQVITYWEFYRRFFSFRESNTQADLDRLLDYYEKEKGALNKAFGRGRNIFNNKKGNRPAPPEFIERNEKLFAGNLNEYLYTEFDRSKQLDALREYSDTTKRVFKAAGIISFDNGYAELAYKELCSCIFDMDDLAERAFGIIPKKSKERDPYLEYEGNVAGYFCSVTTLRELLDYTDDKIEEIVRSIQREFGGKDIEEIPGLIADKRKQEFSAYIDDNYPIDKVKEILKLFNDRNNDKKIKDTVSPDAIVPTIYEYIVGIAWYYFSGKKIDLLDSYNLTLSADFEPLVHAGGGQGDIVIYEEGRVIMLEATLMNANSQKRGEWEPVLRHSVNLKIEEEENDGGRDVTTFFIADTFDANTINIWKAIASVPLQSSVDKNKFTDNVIIMPIHSDELSMLMDKDNEYDDILQKIRGMFEKDKVRFDMGWRDRFIERVF